MSMFLSVYHHLKISFFHATFYFYSTAPHRKILYILLNLSDSFSYSTLQNKSLHPQHLKSLLNMMLCFELNYIWNDWSINHLVDWLKMSWRLDNPMSYFSVENIWWFHLHKFAAFLLIISIIWMYVSYCWCLDCWLDKTVIVNTTLWALCNYDISNYFQNLYW